MRIEIGLENERAWGSKVVESGAGVGMFEKWRILGEQEAWDHGGCNLQENRMKSAPYRLKSSSHPAQPAQPTYID